MSKPLSRQHSATNLSIASRQSSTRATALEVYDQMYGTGQTRESVEAALQRIYEPNASNVRARFIYITAPPLMRISFETNSYENPLLTATSRALITDIYYAVQQWTEVDMPTPLAMLPSLFGRPQTAAAGRWFRVLRVWSEVGDICEAESFDGHRKSIVEHTVHILVLPGVHSGRAGGQTVAAASESSLDVVSSASHLYSLPHFQRTSQPCLAVPGTRMAWPSPFHLKLRVISRLEFNGERVTYHRDFWDIRDLVALVPGARLAQYVGTRLAARALAAVGSVSVWLWGGKGADVGPPVERGDERGVADNSLGLLGIDVDCAAPDVDRE